MDSRYEHIVLNEDHVSSIAGTTMKVVELVVEQQAYRWTAQAVAGQLRTRRSGSYTRRSRTTGIIARSSTAISNDASNSSPSFAARRILHR